MVFVNIVIKFLIIASMQMLIFVLFCRVCILFVTMTHLDIHMERGEYTRVPPQAHTHARSRACSLIHTQKLNVNVKKKKKKWEKSERNGTVRQ